MHKRKYTKEQLEFYFKRLMDDLKRIPREEDMQKAKNYPSVKAYVDRFGSWNNAVKQFGNLELAKRKCKNCGKILVKTKRNQKFCSNKCSREFQSKMHTRYTKTIDKKIRALLHNECFVCGFDKLLEIYCVDNKKISNTKLLKAYNDKDLSHYIMLCPNHLTMINKKMATIKASNDDFKYFEY